MYHAWLVGVPNAADKADSIGTPFMARLSAHLKYYVTKRITEDAEWRNVKVILSGHDVS